MSSSVFAETSIPASDSLLNGDGSAAGKADSNLVVVYGKNGINVDRKGLENLIDEKTLTSISVIRITSPTPSMHEEEAEEKRKEDEKNAADDDKSHSTDDEEDERENSDSEDEPKPTKTNKAPAKERPEIVGLTVEEFYPPEAAKELAKEILKYAGVTPLKCNVDYEFQRYVIKNDHCYTPFTSPSQMVKAKSTLQDDDKQPIPSVRKQSAAGATVKQYLNKRKLLIDEKQRKQSDKEKSSVADADENVADDERLDDDPDEDADEDLDDDDSDYTEESVQSAESDNDRDSDLDFDVNNRHGRKRKTALSRRKKKEKQRARSVMMQKAASSKRRQQSQDNSTNEEDKTLLTPVKMNRQLLDSRKSIGVFTTVKGIAKKQATESSDAVVTGHSLPPPPSHSKQLINIQSVQVIQPAKSILPVHPVVVDRPAQVVAKPLQQKPTATPSTMPQSPQTVKQIVINKVIASPKGGFTDLSTLLARSENLQTETKPEKPPTPSITKGFMPLGVDAASKNQLPAQISIQTHQSSSELAAENDKQQLDLIDTIFKEELEKSFKSSEKSSLKENSIPDLVKMLESTEKAVLEQKKITSTFTSSSVEAIDIANAPLLETPDDEIPDDLLEHVAELMEDKSLQEVVEKEILQQQQKQQQQAKSLLVQQPQPQQIILPVRQLPLISTPVSKQPKSIIEASISNTTTPSTSRDTTPTPASNRPATLQTYGRKEPIQIVRGNGRVITLPPIEAPTTRAKRRAQAKPSVDTSFIDSESGDVSMHSDTSLFTDVSVTEKPEPVTPLPTVKPATKATPAAKKKGSAKASKKAAVALNPSEDHESQEDEDEDDPNKLWCICRQPHNNRFMICCDVCEDWFHGTCVNITKAMGLEMEQKGIEWTCPKCVKKQEVKKQRKITDLFDKKTLVLPMPKLDDQPKPPTLVQSTITVTELPAQKRHLIDLKKLQPGRFYTLAKVDATKPAQPDQPAVTAAVSASPMPESTITSTPVQRKLTDFSIKKTPEANVGVGGSVAKRVIVLPSNAKTLNRGIAMAKTAAAQQQQPPIKFTKVPTAAEKKQFTLTKLQQQPQAKTVAAAAPESEQVQVAVSNSHSQQQQKPPVQKQESIEMLTCIVCKKNARANSIYCSDDCIRKHAQNALNNVSKNAVKSPEPVATPSPVKLGPDEKKKKSKGLFEDLLSLVDRKPKVERVYVFERRTGKMLTGNNAPTTLNLKKWLQDNPTFEVVQPGSPQAAEIEKIKQKNRMSVQSPTNSHTFTPVRPDGPIVTSVITIAPAKVHSPSPVLPKISKAQEANKSITKPAASSPTVNQPQRSLTPKQLLKQPHQVAPKPDKPDKDKDKPSSSSTSSSSSSSKVLKKQVSTEKEAPAAQTPTRNDSSEPVRVNVRRTLKEQLLIRMNDLSDDNKLTPQQVEHFVKATELEMYRLFNKDIGTKYKAKYRSLMFNIKDRKNETLLQKICAKLIEPSQLVRMSPEELASQELAQWRENEAKHQLEMIKKSELDMLSCTKNYVLKTHKGEEVIEGKSADRVELDISIPVEDVVAVLNNSTVSSTTEIDSSLLAPKKDVSSDFDNNASMSQDTQPPAASSTSDKKKQSNKERDRDREKRHKSKDRHKEKTRKRSRSRSREHKHKSSSRKDERRDREDRATKKDDHDSMAKTAKLVAPLKIDLPPTTTVVPKLLTPTKVAHKEREQPIIKKSTKPPPIEQFNLIDQILESEKTVEEAANLTHEKNTSAIPLITAATDNIATQKVDDSTATSSSSATKSQPQSPLGADSDQEPSSTVSISTPPEDPYYKYSSDSDATLWTGLINMIDVASFQVSIQAVSGNTYLLSKMLPDELDVVGRISPDTVWDYIGKIKRSPNKEIVIIRLVPAVESENIAYTILYKYLDKRKRLGVIKATSPNIKDFYIMPLGVGQQMPSVLRPSENFDFYDDVMRPDMLLGIVIRIMGKRHSNAVQRRKKESTVISNRQSTLSLDGEATNTFTPPGSPKSRADSSRSGQSGSSRAMRMPHKSTDEDEFDIDAIIKAPITSKNASKGQAPAAAKKDDADEPYSPGGSSDDDVQNVPIRDDDLKRKMDEINRQIEAQKMEIAGLLGQEQSSYSSGSNALAPALANISIPSNLQQILASIQSKPDPPALSSSAPSMVPPPPMIGSLAMQSGNPDEEYTPELPIMRSHNAGVSNQQRMESKPGRLAQLSEAELLSMVPDDIDIDQSNTSSHKNVGGGDQPPEKRPRWSDAPPPGMDVDY